MTVIIFAAKMIIFIDMSRA